MLFPLAFALFALPVPLRILNPLQNVLQDGTTWASFHALTALGFDVTRSEFVLGLPGGRLRVEEAARGDGGRGAAAAGGGRRAGVGAARP